MSRWIPLALVATLAASGMAQDTDADTQQPSAVPVQWNTVTLQVEGMT